MRRFFQFHWLCIRHAWCGCWTRANEQAAVLGGVLLAIILWLSSPALRERGMIEVPSTIWGAAIYAASSAVACVILAFAVIFVGRLVLAPVRLYWTERDRADLLSKKEASKPRLKLSYAAEKTRKLSGGSRATYLYATNEGGYDVSGAQVKIEQAQFKRDGSDIWENTSILARTNMSWGDKPDVDPQKYSTVQLAPGSEPIDFITGPRIVHQTVAQTRLGFVIRIDPRHLGNVDPSFWEAGTYKFVMQVSALNVEKPDKLTLFADWDGRTLAIRSDDNPSQVLETCEVLAA